MEIDNEAHHSVTPLLTVVVVVAVVVVVIAAVVVAVVVVVLVCYDLVECLLVIIMNRCHIDICCKLHSIESRSRLLVLST